MLQILHAVKTKKNSFKTLITSEYTSVKVELAKFFEMGVSNKPPEFIKMKPPGKVWFYIGKFVVIYTLLIAC